ncbi:MAG: hypothetical protein JF621_18540 [Streptomyces turgidiscabies]|nr:hypothetical protein [Streptomyces turgidiscabies]
MTKFGPLRSTGGARRVRKVALEAIARIETAPVLRTYKAAATLWTG